MANVRWGLAVAGVAVAFAIVPAGESEAASVGKRVSVKCPAGTAVLDYCGVEVSKGRTVSKRR